MAVQMPVPSSKSAGLTRPRDVYRRRQLLQSRIQALTFGKQPLMLSFSRQMTTLFRSASSSKDLREARSFLA